MTFDAVDALDALNIFIMQYRQKNELNSRS